MEDHVAVEAVGTLYDLASQICVSVWLGSEDAKRGAEREQDVVNYLMDVQSGRVQFVESEERRLRKLSEGESYLSRQVFDRVVNMRFFISYELRKDIFQFS